MLQVDWKKIIETRHHLHQYPELSEIEHDTSFYINEWLVELGGCEVISQLGSMRTGICAVFSGVSDGPVIGLRSELDALAINEDSDLPHKSCRSGIAHMCGHDGHMATLLAVASDLRARPIEKGKVVLIFQPAEETGTGAQALIEDDRFRDLEIDLIFGLHNIPKAPMGQVIMRKGTFAAASLGAIISFNGETSHSGYPEHGRSPVGLVSELLRTIENQGSLGPRLKDWARYIISSVHLGEVGHGPNFGVSPGEATVMMILRAYENEDMALLKSELESFLKKASAIHKIEFSLTYHEPYNATKSDDQVMDELLALAEKKSWDFQLKETPFRWSEDFGRYTEKYKGAFFGLGSGAGQPQLHNSDYDYPDELIPLGAKVYRDIIDNYLKVRG